MVEDAHSILRNYRYELKLLIDSEIAFILMIRKGILKIEGQYQLFKTDLSLRYRV